jgi:hypothetical protein
MNHSNAEPVSIIVNDEHTVSGILLAPARARACYLFAHGAGAGMAHPFMDVVATELGDSFHVPARMRRNDANVRSEMLNALVAWTLSVTS